jgi:hypothetical protein
MHKDILWFTTDLWMNGHWKNKIIVLSVGVVKLVAPEALQHMGINKPVLNLVSERCEIKAAYLLVTCRRRM